MKKSESEKPGLKLSIQKAKVMACGPITSRQIEGENVEAVTIIPPHPPWALKSLWTVAAAMKLKDTYSLEGKLWQTWMVVMLGSQWRV